MIVDTNWDALDYPCNVICRHRDDGTNLLNVGDVYVAKGRMQFSHGRSSMELNIELGSGATAWFFADRFEPYVGTKEKRHTASPEWIV